VCVGGEGDAVEAFGFQRMEEGFHVGVVIHVTGPVHALDQAIRGETAAQVVSGVLDAAI
jgi:hypothetical protein